jgi:hypothetical protein
MIATHIFMLQSLLFLFSSPQFVFALFPLTSPRCGDVIDADAVLISWDAFDEPGQQGLPFIGLCELVRH